MSFFRIYRLINALSLDVVAGAVVSALFFGKVFNVHILPYGLAALALTVWAIYTADHLWDARSIESEASSFRHRFHQKYFLIMLALLSVVILADVVMIFFIRPRVLAWGAVLACMIACYLVIQKKYHFMKEIMVSGLYLFGVLLPSLSVTSEEITAVHVFLILQFFVIGLLNLYIFSWFDAERDDIDRLGSFVTRYGIKKTERFIMVLFIAFMILSVTVAIMGADLRLMLVPIAMAGVLFAIFVFPNWFAHHDRYRMIGDAVFFIPLAYILWP